MGFREREMHLNKLLEREREKVDFLEREKLLERENKVKKIWNF